MKKYLTALATVLALSAPAAADWSITKMNTTIEQTNFLVNSGCSGTLLNYMKGVVLTAYHCVDNQYETVTREKIGPDGKVTEEKVRVAKPGTVTQKTFSGPNEVQQTSYVFKLVDVDRKNDLALLKIQTPVSQRVPVEIACKSPERGEKVYAVGNSFAVLYSSVSTGIVASVQRNYRDLRIAGDLGDTTDDGEHGLTQHTAVIAPGNSGGALFNDKGELIGVNVRGIPGGFAFAVPLADIQSFLSKNGFSFQCEE